MWKEVVYSKDAFALTAPYPPLPQADPEVADTTVYAVKIPNRKNVSLTLRVMVLGEPQECSANLARLKGMLTGTAPSGNASAAVVSGVDASSVKDLTIDGYHGIEYKHTLGPSRMGLKRSYCAGDRFYAFAASWPAAQGVPQTVLRIMDSIRLLKRRSNRSQMPGRFLEKTQTVNW